MHSTPLGQAFCGFKDQNLSVETGQLSEPTHPQLSPVLPLKLPDPKELKYYWGAAGAPSKKSSKAKETCKEIQRNIYIYLRREETKASLWVRGCPQGKPGQRPGVQDEVIGVTSGKEYFHGVKLTSQPH